MGAAERARSSSDLRERGLARELGLELAEQLAAVVVAAGGGGVADERERVGVAAAAAEGVGERAMSALLRRAGSIAERAWAAGSHARFAAASAASMRSVESRRAPEPNASAASRMAWRPRSGSLRRS